MEQRMLENRRGRRGLKAIADNRAMELQMEHPQLMTENPELETTKEMRGGCCGGGEAGMKRVIGSGKKRGRPAKVKAEGGTDGIMVGGAKDMGRKLAEQIMAIHGGAYLSEMMSGMNAGEVPVAKGRKVRGGASVISAPPSGREVAHAIMSPAKMGLPGQALGGQDVPPGGVAPVAYGNTPQAPASFKRNTVGAGRPAGAGMCGGAKMKKGGQMDFEKEMLKEKETYEPTGAEMTKGLKKTRAITKLMTRSTTPPSQKTTAKNIHPRPAMEMKEPASKKTKTGGAKKSSVRGQQIAKLMKEKGMTLPQASKYLKEHGSA